MALKTTHSASTSRSRELEPMHQRVFSVPLCTPQLMPVSWSASTLPEPHTRSQARLSTPVDQDQAHPLQLPHLQLLQSHPPLQLQSPPAHQLPALSQPPLPLLCPAPPQWPLLHQSRRTITASKRSINETPRPGLINPADAIPLEGIALFRANKPKNCFCDLRSCKYFIVLVYWIPEWFLDKGTCIHTYLHSS